MRKPSAAATRYFAQPINYGGEILPLSEVYSRLDATAKSCGMDAAQATRCREAWLAGYFHMHGGVEAATRPQQVVSAL